MTITIYHNPRCSKSRKTLELLHERGLDPTVVEYLKTPPDAETIHKLLDQLGATPDEIIRQTEHLALGLPPTDDVNELVRRIASHPEILQRPIVLAGGKAAIGRPPENVLAILD